MELISPVDYVKESVLAVQDWSQLAGASIRNIFKRPRYMPDIVYQADIIGVGSLPIVVLTGFFTGAVLALQTSDTLARFGSSSLTGRSHPTAELAEIAEQSVGCACSSCSAVDSERAVAH